jgi:N-formylglutamate amidohydrolase
MSKLPVLILIPHGGYKIPDELSETTFINKEELFFEADTCANEIFSLKDIVYAVIDTEISRLFIDIDRQLTQLPPSSTDGIIKIKTAAGKRIFREGFFPNDLALANIIDRYYTSFHETAEKIIKTEGVKLILECHTMSPVGPKNSADTGMPRPLISLQNIIFSNDKSRYTCQVKLTENLIALFQKYFSKEDATVAKKFEINNPLFSGYLLSRYGTGKIPMIRMSLSKSLFLSDEYLDINTLEVKPRRLFEIRDKISLILEKFCKEL